MSAVRAGHTRPATAPTDPAPRQRPKLRIVHPPAPGRTRVPFLLLCVTILGSAMLAALILNTSMAATSYEIHSTELELARLSQTNEDLAAEVDELSAPARVADRAQELGMERSEEVNFINLSEETVSGPAAGDGDE